MPSFLPINERLERIDQLVRRSRHFYDIWLYFEGEDTRRPIIEDRFYEFFRIDRHAHFVAFVVHIAALFEKRKNRISLPCLAKEMKAQLISTKRAAEVDALLSYADQLASKVQILRSNLFAHRSASLSYADAFKKADVTADQLRDLTEIALKIVNHLLLVGGLREYHSFDPDPLRHAEAMLKALMQKNMAR